MHQLNRRSFIKGSLFTAGSIMAGRAKAEAGERAFSVVPAKIRGANDKLSIGAIGVRGKGWSDWIPMFENGENIVALCDTDRTAIEKGLSYLHDKGVNTSQVKCYSDYRKMLDECGPRLDAVTVSTPDHTHAPAAIRAMKMGINAYVQKPLVRTIWEARYFEKVAKAEGVVTQMGNQGSATEGFRRTVEILNSGILGKVTEVHVWTNRPKWPQGILRPAGEDPIPATLDWNGWLGTAEPRPFKAGVYHSFKWRGFFDFGTGAFGDMACHTMNLPYRGLMLGRVESAECVTVTGQNPETYPVKSIVKLHYAARASLPAVDLYWYDGNLIKNGQYYSIYKPKAEMMPEVVATLGAVPNTGCYIRGDKGTLVSTDSYGDSSYIALKGEKKMRSTKKVGAFSEVPVTLPRSPEGHYLEFVNACKGLKKAYSDIGFSILMVEGMLVGCIAQKVPGKLVWDSASQRFDNAAANALLKPFIRRGFEF